LEQIKRLTSPPYFNIDGFFIAEKESSPVGCIGVFNLPAKGYLWIGYLAVKEALSNITIVDKLIKAAVEYALSKKPKLLKAVTLMIQPYVNAYKRFGFRPVRRILRIAWDPIKIPEKEGFNQKISVAEVSEDNIDEAAYILVEGIQPYWDWWLEEEGGSDAVLKKSVE